MCNLYSVTKGQAAIIELTRALRDKTGNLPPMPGVFPDYLAPIVRNAPDGVRELMLARWGMPGPPQFGGTDHQHPQYQEPALARVAQTRKSPRRAV
jgi:putative SOS response-associated peptidase YedK